jgi:hypothetical protein
VNTADLRSLADRAEGLEGRQSARLREVHDRIRVARRRRRAAAVAGAAVLAVVVAGTAVMVRPDDERTAPAPATPSPSTPEPTPSGEDTTALDRPLTYAVGQTIHYGDQVIDTGHMIAQVDITDAGVVYLTRSGQLWFTDGSQKRQVDPGTGSYSEGYEAKTAAVGNRVAWLRYDGEQPVAVVEYDVASGEEVFNEPAGPAVWPDFDTTQPQAQALFLTADEVVVQYSDDNYRSREVGQVRYVSYDLDTARRTELSFDEMQNIQVSPLTRVLDWRARAGQPDNLSRGSTDHYRVRDGILTIDVFDNQVGVWRVADPIDPVTGARLRIPAPAELPARTQLRLSQWLDDGVFALTEIDRSGEPAGALVVCTLSEPGCQIAEAGPANWILPGREFYE